MTASFARRHGKIASNVEDLLSRFPSLLSDYRKVVWYYWWYVDRIDDLFQANRMINPESFSKLTQPESIMRAFRKIVNEEGKFKLPPHVKMGRQRQQEMYRQHYRVTQLF